MRSIATVAILVLMMVGCDRAQVTSPATAPAAVATTAPATQPTAAFMLIDGQRVEFPPAKLAVREKGGALTAVLYSDDPPDAIDDSYTGNSFYLEMQLDVADSTRLDLARWAYKAPSSERIDSMSGIYLNGRKRQLQPFDVGVEFEGSGSPVQVWLRGQFLRFDSDRDHTVPGVITPVSGELQAALVVKQAQK